MYIYNKLKDIEKILLYNKTNKNLFINEINNNYHNYINWKKDINYLSN